MMKSHEIESKPGERIRSPLGTFARFAFQASIAALAWTSFQAAAVQAWPEPTSPIPKPGNDAFYASPTTQELTSALPGEVLRYRPITAKKSSSAAIAGQAWQLMYRSNDHKNAPVAAIATVLVPTSAPSTERKLYVYNTAYDALTLDCAPSYTSTVSGVGIDQSQINSALSKGWVTLMPDYEGLNSYWALGVNAGRLTLDAIRAAESFTPLRLSTATPVAVNGYSGGAVASTWTNELYKEYAPELNIVGVAAGGIPVDLGAVARKVDGTWFEGLYVGVVTALARAYPEVPVDTLTNAAGKAALQKAGGMCATNLSLTSNILIAFASHKMSEYVTVPDLLNAPVVTDIIAENRLGQRVPGAPTYLYNGTVDEVMPIEQVRSLVKGYCTNGAKVQFKQLVGQDHVLGEFLGPGAALSYIEDRFNGKAAPSNCP